MQNVNIKIFFSLFKFGIGKTFRLNRFLKRSLNCTLTQKRYFKGTHPEVSPSNEKYIFVASGQSYKPFASVNYNPRVVICANFLVSTTLSVINYNFNVLFKIDHKLNGMVENSHPVSLYD